jgi:hypothetical protein
MDDPKEPARLCSLAGSLVERKPSYSFRGEISPNYFNMDVPLFVSANGCLAEIFSLLVAEKEKKEVFRM